MTSLGKTTVRGVFIGNNWQSSGTRSNQLLDSGYVHGVSGDAVALRYIITSTSPINEIYIFLDAYGGNIINQNMQCDIYNEHATSVLMPGSTLRATSTVTYFPFDAKAWIRFTFSTPYTPAIGEILWFVFYNTSSIPTADYQNILLAHTTTAPLPLSNRAIGFSTTTGFSTNGTQQTEFPFVIVQGSSAFGNPITSGVVNPPSNTLERGMKFTPPITMNIIGIEWQSGATAALGIKLYSSEGVPGGTPLYSWNLGTDANQNRDELIGAKIFPTPITLTGGTTYLVTLTQASNNANPHLAYIEDYVSYPSLFDQFLDYFTMCPRIIDNGAGGWTQTNYEFPNIQLIVSDVSAGSSGGGMRLAGPGGLAA